MPQEKFSGLSDVHFLTTRVQEAVGEDELFHPAKEGYGLCGPEESLAMNEKLITALNLEPLSTETHDASGSRVHITQEYVVLPISQYSAAVDMAKELRPVQVQDVLSMLVVIKKGYGSSSCGSGPTTTLRGVITLQGIYVPFDKEQEEGPGGIVQRAINAWGTKGLKNEPEAINIRDALNIVEHE